MKRGIWAVYKGMEYEAIGSPGDTYDLISRDPAEQAQGFVPWYPGKYKLSVHRSELEGLYSISHSCIYQGLSVSVEGERDGQILLLAGTAVAREHGFTQVDRGVYEKWVTPGEVDALQEKRTPL